MSNEIKIVLPRLYDKQKEIVNDPARFKIVCAGRRVGKTILVQNVAINAMLKGLRVCYITPAFHLADEAFDKIIKTIPDAIISKQNKSNRHIHLITNGTINFFSGEALNRTRGFEFDVLIIDEASQIPDLRTEWNQALRPLLLKTKGTAYIISTPLGKNYFHSLYVKGVNNENGFKSWRFSSYENPHLPKDELDALIKEMPDVIYPQEILAEPMQNGNSPFTLNNVQPNIIETLSTKETIVYGIDLARVNDYTVITGLSVDGEMTFFSRFQLPYELTMQKIQELPSNILKIIDSTGVGESVVEQLQLRCKNIQGFKFTSESKPRIIYQLVKEVEQGNLKFNQETANELLTYEWKLNPNTGHVSFNAASGGFDDAVISLSLASHFRARAIATKNWKIYVV